MKNVYGNTIESLMECVRKDQAAVGSFGLLRDSMRILSYDGRDKNGNILYKRINPAKAYGRMLIDKKEMEDPRNHLRFTEIKHRFITGTKDGNPKKKSLLLKYNDVLICPDLSIKEGNTFVSTMAKAIGGFRPDSKSEIDSLYLAALLADVDRDLLVGYVSERGKHGVIHPFFCTLAPEELNMEYFINKKNADDSVFDLSEIVKERDLSLEKAMADVWAQAKISLKEIVGAENAESLFRNGSDDYGMMRSGSVCLMQVCPCDIFVLHNIPCEDGIHDYFKISPLTYKQISDYDVFDRKKIILTKKLRMACGLDEETLVSEQFLVSGKDKSGSMYLVVPEKIMFKRLCEMDDYPSLTGDCDVMIRNLILGRIIGSSASGLLFMTGRRVHEFKSGGSIFISNSIKASDIVHDYSKGLDEVCKAAVNHTMRLKDWERTKDVYFVRFEVMNAMSGRPAEINLPDAVGQMVTCGVEYSFSVRMSKSFKLCAAFFIGKGAAMCGAPVVKERRAMSRRSKKSARPVKELIRDFFGENGDYMHSPYVFLLKSSGLMFSCGQESSLTAMLDIGSAKYKDDINTLLAIKRREYNGGGRNKIIYAMGRNKVEERLDEFTEEQIAGWSVFDYAAFVASFASRGVEDENRGKIMSFVGKIISETENAS